MGLEPCRGVSPKHWTVLDSNPSKADPLVPVKALSFCFLESAFEGRLQRYDEVQLSSHRDGVHETAWLLVLEADAIGRYERMGFSDEDLRSVKDLKISHATSA